MTGEGAPRPVQVCRPAGAPPQPGPALQAGMRFAGSYRIETHSFYLFVGYCLSFTIFFPHPATSETLIALREFLLTCPVSFISLFLKILKAKRIAIELFDQYCRNAIHWFVPDRNAQFLFICWLLFVVRHFFLHPATSETLITLREFLLTCPVHLYKGDRFAYLKLDLKKIINLKRRPFDRPVNANGSEMILK